MLDNINKMKTKFITSDPEIMGGQPVVKGTRIIISRIIFLLKEGYPMDAIHAHYPWVDIKTLEGVIGEIDQIVTEKFHAKKIL